MVALLSKLYGSVEIRENEYICDSDEVRVVIYKLRRSVVLVEASGRCKYPELVRGLMNYCVEDGRALVIPDALDDELNDIYKLMREYNCYMEEYPVYEGIQYTTVALTRLRHKQSVTNHKADEIERNEIAPLCLA